jgi:hypothetical protein
MSNTLTNLIPTIYEAKDFVLREMTGLIAAVTLDASAEQAAKDETIRYPVVPALTAAAISPAATGPDPSATSQGSDTMSISKVYSSTFFWEAEEQLGLKSLYQVILRDQFTQAMRVLANAVEADLAALYKYASRAYGTAGTTPFDSTNKLTFVAQLHKILVDNGAPQTDLQLVLDTTAGAALRSLTELWKVNESGGSDLLRKGELLPLEGFSIRESGQIKAITKGTGTGYLVDLTAGYAAGSTTMHVDTGAGTILAGDILTNNKTGRDTNKYVVATGFAGDGDGDIVLAKPGLQVAAVNNDPVGVAANFTPNMAFSRSAIHLLMRVPAMPEGGDAADDVIVVTDDQTGISFQVAMYRQRRRIAYEVGLAWGVKAVKSEAIALLLG